ncbi:MAG: acyltransferase [Ilumatobacteraceae bacterium]|jgi:peptidoglycan/LPS O-acetylase OafA/YrhL|nr:acyltransferase [Ilumatobacteraceae bacterium]
MTQAPQHRSDVQVLRAVAVIAVIAYHAGLPVRSGFLGVDVFLVISGYVICATLLRESSRTGSISIPKFYIRRVRRLFLPLLTMLAVSMLLFWMFGPFIAHRSVSRQAFSALGFFANFHYFSMAGGYFDPEKSASFFLHTWSLSLEEQFYLVFPLIVALIVFLSRRSTARTLNRNVLIGVVALAASSLAFSWWLIASFPVSQVFTQSDTSFIGRIKIDAESFAFFSPLTRAWQFLVGAACAVGAARAWQLKNHRLRVWFEPALFALLVALLVIDGSASTSFFAPNRVAVTVVTGLLVFAGFDGFTVLSAIGDRSYSLYLWHFPLLSFTSLKFDASATSRTVAVLMSIVCAELSYRFIETRSLAIDVEYFLKRARTALIVSVATFVLIAAIGIAGWPEKFANNVLQRDVVAIPIAHWAKPTARCANMGDGFTYKCNNGEATNTQLLLVGDSHARGLALGFGMAADALQRSWSANTAIGCTFARFTVGRQFDFCDVWVEKTIRRVLELRPELVVLFQCYRVGVGCPQPTMSAERREEYSTGVASVIDELNDAGIAVLYVLDTPAVLPEQASPSLILNNSRVPIQRGARATNADVAKLLRQTANASGGLLQFANITNGLCNKESCRYVSSDNQPLWFDADHLSLFGVRDRTEPLRSAIEKALTQTTSP